MVLSTRIAYGAYVLLYVARCGETPCGGLEEAAGQLGLSPEAGRAVLDAMAEHGLLRRGMNPDQLRLTRPVDQIRLGELLDALAETDQPIPCVQNTQRLCRTYRDLWRLGEHVRRALDNLTIGTLDRAAAPGCTRTDVLATETVAEEHVVPAAEQRAAPGSPRHAGCCDPLE